MIRITVPNDYGAYSQITHYIANRFRAPSWIDGNLYQPILASDLAAWVVIGFWHR